MTSITGSPSPKPRAGRNHRQTKSSSSISAPIQFNAKHNTQQPNPHSRNNRQLPPNLVPSNRVSSRSSTGIMTPPQTPKAQQFPGTDVLGKRRKNKRQDKSRQERASPKDTTVQIPPAFSSVPIPVEIESPPMSSDELAGGQITPPKFSSTPPSKAYAGPTFHSSPAPSALPMPKFFSKSVPATPAGTSLQLMMESDVSDATAPASPDRKQEQPQSHLELLFRAARAENMGIKRHSSGSTSSSESTDSSSASFGADPESPIHSNSKTARNIQLESGLFSMDEFDKPMSPTYKRRINQTRSVTSPSKLPSQTGSEEEERQKVETANALKQFLLAPQSPTRKTPVSSPSPASRAQNKSPRAQNKSPRAQNRPPPPLFKAGPPLRSAQNAYQIPSPRSPSHMGYFPLFPSTMSFPYKQEPASYTASAAPLATPPRGPAPYRVSFQPYINPIEGKSDRIDTYMTSQQFPGVSQNKLYHNDHNSILASKLEAVKVTPAKSVTDLENDLRRVLMI